jgi:hypothetical protein
MAVHPRQEASISEYEVQDDIVLFEPRGASAHVLNGTAAVVWRLCDGEHGSEDIAATLAGLYGREPSSVLADVRSALAAFRDAGLIQWQDHGEPAN